MTSGVITLHRQGNSDDEKQWKTAFDSSGKGSPCLYGICKAGRSGCPGEIILAALAVFSPDKPCSIQARDRKACKKSNSGIYRKHVEQKTEHHETGRKKVAAFTGHRKQRLMQENKDYRNLSEQIRGKVITMIKTSMKKVSENFIRAWQKGST